MHQRPQAVQQPRMSPEEAAQWLREKTIAEANALLLADAVYKIVFYNSQHSNRSSECQIDPFQVFDSASPEAIEDWIERTKRLLASNYTVGDAIVDKSDRANSLEAQYIASNPGFSAKTYEHAVWVGIGKAVH